MAVCQVDHRPPLIASRLIMRASQMWRALRAAKIGIAGAAGSPPRSRPLITPRFVLSQNLCFVHISGSLSLIRSPPSRRVLRFARSASPSGGRFPPSMWRGWYRRAPQNKKFCAHQGRENRENKIQCVIFPIFDSPFDICRLSLCFLIFSRRCGIL